MYLTATTITEKHFKLKKKRSTVRNREEGKDIMWMLCSVPSQEKAIHRSCLLHKEKALKWTWLLSCNKRLQEDALSFLVLWWTFILDIRRKFFTALRSFGYPIPRGIQGQVGRAAHGSGLELDGLKGPFQSKSFYDSVIGIFSFCLVGYLTGSCNMTAYIVYIV